ncbi:MAG TPA: SDR family NAD(P)-dependent oxidoreductase [Candidatus Avalokitesvara rifleensis]|uniref:SDR family NAD(P)-dependent oxidoreductase n=1 Tax=Candidatus Avalokitesvara rifleensis TaxID=3367620 RepID=UPI0027136BEA|nr:SDR family oxidoreductase [Candidatus Brocadiales bacterium]
MDLGIKGKNALVTGGSHGIGRSVALALAEEGCNVAICARNKEGVEKTAAEIKTKEVDSLGIPADVMVLSDIQRVMKTIIDSWGTIHILVNNVGGGGRWGSDVVEETREDVWLDVYSKNALASIRFAMLAIPYMRKQKWGRVVTITSIFGREGGGRPWFSMAKSAQTSLMKSLALKHYLARDGITFNSVAPGAIMIPDTGWEKEVKKDLKGVEEMLEKEFPLGRFGTPEEVASVVVFICSEKASLLNGASIPVDGAQSRSYL